MPFQLKLVLIYGPRRDGSLSWPYGAINECIRPTAVATNTTILLRMQQQISGEKQRRDPAAVASSLFANFKQQHNNCGIVCVACIRLKRILFSLETQQLTKWSWIVSLNL